MQIFVIQEYDLREQDRLLLALFALTLAAYVQHGDGGQLCESARAGAHRHGDERIVAAAGCYRVELVFPALEALLKVVENVRHNFFLDRISIQTQTSILLGQHFVAALGIRLEQQIDRRHGKAAVLLARRRQHDIADHVKCNIKCFRLVVPQIAHLKAVLEDTRYIKQAAVHGIAARRHIVDVNVAVPTGLQFLGVHKELLVQLLIELIEDQAALGGDQRGIRVGIFLIADIHDGLAFLVYAVQHADKILLIVAVVAVAFGNLRPHRLKRRFDDVVHLPDLNLGHVMVTDITLDMIADRLQLILCKVVEDAVCRLIDGDNNLLDVKRFFGVILFDNSNHVLFFLSKFHTFIIISYCPTKSEQKSTAVYRRSAKAHTHISCAAIALYHTRYRFGRIKFDKNIIHIFAKIILCIKSSVLLAGLPTILYNRGSDPDSKPLRPQILHERSRPHRIAAFPARKRRLYLYRTASFRGRSYFLFRGVFMQTRVAVMGIVVENTDSVERLNTLLHEYGSYIIGRMGIPYRARNINIVSIAIDAPQDVISALSGKIGNLDGISVKTAYSNVQSDE